MPVIYPDLRELVDISVYIDSITDKKTQDLFRTLLNQCLHEQIQGKEQTQQSTPALRARELGYSLAEVEIAGYALDKYVCDNMRSSHTSGTIKYYEVGAVLDGIISNFFMMQQRQRGERTSG